MAALNPAVTMLRNKLIRQKLAEGTGPAEIARQLGASKQGISAVIRRHNLDKHGGQAKPRLSDAEKRIVAVARKAGVTLTVDGEQIL